jgi:chaperonin GroEL
VIKTDIQTDGNQLDSLLRGAEKLYKAVSVTMGPKGQNVIFKKYGKRAGVTHDGVTVAKLVKCNNEAEDVGADLLREAAMKLDATTGDGTTTVTVLAYHILKEAAEAIRGGESPMSLKLAIEALQPKIIAQIQKHTDNDVTLEKLQQVASVSSGDKEIGKAVGKVMFEAGKDTPIMLGFSQNNDTTTEVINGFKIDSGPASPYLMEGAGVKLEIPEVKIIVADAKLRDKDDVMPILQLMSTVPETERRFLLVCSDVAGDALAYMVANRLKGFAEIAVARVPAHISSHAEYLSDVAVACGAKVLSRNTGNTIKEPKIEHLGSADKVTVEPRETVIVNGHPIKEDLDTRLQQLQEFKKSGKTEAARKFAQDRLMTLEQKVVGIFVGGQSETEAEERHYRYEDAVGACRAALRGGVVPGGGTLLWSLSTMPVLIHGPDEQNIAGDILGSAMRQPLLKVLSNAGISVDGLAITLGLGVDVMHPEDGVIDLVERGIIDPAESEIECVKTAISIAGLLMTSGALIVDEGEPDEVKQ